MLYSNAGPASAVRWITNGDCSDACSVGWRDWSRCIPESPMADHPVRATKVCPVCGRRFNGARNGRTSGRRCATARSAAAAAVPALPIPMGWREPRLGLKPIQKRNGGVCRTALEAQRHWQGFRRMIGSTVSEPDVPASWSSSSLPPPCSIDRREQCVQSCLPMEAGCRQWLTPELADGFITDGGRSHHSQLGLISPSPPAGPGKPCGPAGPSGLRIASVEFQEPKAAAVPAERYCASRKSSSVRPAASWRSRLRLSMLQRRT